ncbi:MULTISPECIES: hypothetical protein [Providencia]|uniref:Uncharacterized protein n=2 Tax=Providencia TaxID=586 RepID=A0AA42FIG0_9GAMM|nr:MULTISPECIES: hypothetical protein [Providencia]MBV2190294.1 hypothetical protein [Providencia rettgeri]MDG4695686.1 hypothetical protein [Providencia sp. CRE-3FA-0001]MDT0133131.1 hypothetical protein [Providencia huaxiensis]MDT1979537.1 hypothetical protein [Providencia huaxiensis]
MSSDTTEERKDSLLDDKITLLLERRARFVRWANIGLILILVSAAVMVAFLIISGKDSQRSWISEAMTALNKNSLKIGDAVIYKPRNDGEYKVGFYDGNGLFIYPDNIASKETHLLPKDIKNSEIDSQSSNVSGEDTSERILNAYKKWSSLGKPEKSESEKIADSIATVLLNLSLIIFIGFVMKAVLVFIKYYMQLGTDFENQKLAYVLSKGHVGDFSIILKNLRENSINLEKTPTLPQEKIILSLIESMGKSGEKK